MKKTWKKKSWCLVLALMGLTLSSCSIFDLATKSSSAVSNSNGSTTNSSSSVSTQDNGLITSSKDGSSYGGNAKNVATPTSSNYAIKTSKYTQKELNDSTGDYPMNAKGTRNLLVIPVKIDDYSDNATEAVRANIFNTFFGDASDTGWESLASYYYKSSYQQLLINGTVSDWYDCGYTAKQLSKLTSNESSYDPTWTVLENAISWYKNKYKTDCTEFDNDGDGLIDGVWLLYSAPDASNSTTLKNLDESLFWAYTFCDYSLSGSTLSKKNPQAYHYCWASYDFMYEGYGEEALDAHTYIHETGHLMGLDDYYVASKDKNTKNYDPMGAVDMMDYNIIDHNAYSKFAYGWVTPYVVSGETTITLHPSSTTGECVLIPTSKGWNGSCFDEYMLLEYYTPTVLNEKDSQQKYTNGIQGFTENGVRIYHVDARMTVISNSSDTYEYTDTLVSSSTKGTATAHSNSSGYNYLNKHYRLIQAMDCTDKHNFDIDSTVKDGTTYYYAAKNSSLFQDGDSFSFASYNHSFPRYAYNYESKMDNGGTFDYNIAFSNSSSDSITLTITNI